MGYNNLLKEGKIGRMGLRNRTIMPGMGTNLAAADGTASDVIVNYYARRAQGGVGLIITEVCAPEPEGVVIPGEIEISSRKYMPSLSRIPHAVHAGGAKVCLQLAHAGCFASETVTGVRPKSPSGVGTFRLPDENPREMSINEIENLIEKYALGVQRARQCGFDAVEIHGAHGYMPLQFMSGYTNRRQDKYGGSLENRARFALEIVRRSKEYAGRDFPLIYRLSAEEYVPKGLTLKEAKIVAKWLEEAGVDAINVSAGTWDSRFLEYNAAIKGEATAKGKNLNRGVGTSVWVSPNYIPRGTLVDYAKEIKKCVDIPVIGVGGITPEAGEKLIASNELDFVCIGRQIIADPDYVNKLKEGKPDTIKRCLRCNDCLGEVNKSCGISCAINPEAGREYEEYTKIKPISKIKKVAVIGSGPAGIQASLTSMERGYNVTLFEKNDRLGGALYYVSLPDFKNDYKDYVKYLINALDSKNITIKLNTEATVEMLEDSGFDVVIVATGASTFIPNIAGTEEGGILDPLKVLDGDIPEGVNIVICGAGLVGCEIALYLAKMGKKITMVDMLDEPAKETSITVKWVLNSILMEYDIRIMTNHEIKRMTKNYVECVFNGKTVRFNADAVICALGLKPNRKLLNELHGKERSFEIIPVGDINNPRKIINAVHEGFYAACRI